ncbi:MAG: hypothetical protein PVH88_25920 [Ignavibacteria bacterium]|jgi:hypothetical protein
MKTNFLLLVIALSFILSRCGKKENYNYVEDIKPILEDNCYKCHEGENPVGKINFESYDLLFNGKYIEKDWPIVVPGKSNVSRLYIVVNSNNTGIRMPPENLGYDKIDEDDILIIKEWIDAGAKDR